MKQEELEFPGVRGSFGAGTLPPHAHVCICRRTPTFVSCIHLKPHISAVAKISDCKQNFWYFSYGCVHVPYHMTWVFRFQFFNIVCSVTFSLEDLSRNRRWGLSSHLMSTSISFLSWSPGKIPSSWHKLSAKQRVVLKFNFILLWYFCIRGRIWCGMSVCTWKQTHENVHIFCICTYV